MRISDWSSDVCSSDLNPVRRRMTGSQENEMTKQMLAAMATGLALMAAVPAVAQQGGSTVTAAKTQGPILSFSVSAEVRSRPDQATVGAGVQPHAPTAVAAKGLEENTAEPPSVI